VLIHANGVAKLSDMGSAKTREAGVDGHTLDPQTAGAFNGTDEYADPALFGVPASDAKTGTGSGNGAGGSGGSEGGDGKPHVMKETDVWSFAALLYRLFTLQLPWSNVGPVAATPAGAEGSRGHIVAHFLAGLKPMRDDDMHMVTVLEPLLGRPRAELIHGLVLRSWDHDHSQRPSMAQFEEALRCPAARDSLWYCAKLTTPLWQARLDSMHARARKAGSTVALHASLLPVNLRYLHQAAPPPFLVVDTIVDEVFPGAEGGYATAGGGGGDVGAGAVGAVAPAKVDLKSDVGTAAGAVSVLPDAQLVARGTGQTWQGAFTPLSHLPVHLAAADMAAPAGAALVTDLNASLASPGTAAITPIRSGGTVAALPAAPLSPPALTGTIAGASSSPVVRRLAGSAGAFPLAGESVGSPSPGHESYVVGPVATNALLQQEVFDSQRGEGSVRPRDGSGSAAGTPDLQYPPTSTTPVGGVVADEHASALSGSGSATSTRSGSGGAAPSPLGVLSTSLGGMSLARGGGGGGAAVGSGAAEGTGVRIGSNLTTSSGISSGTGTSTRSGSSGSGGGSRGSSGAGSGSGSGGGGSASGAEGSS